MRYLLISCEVFRREITELIRAVPHTVIVDYVPQAWHDYPGPELRQHLQARIDEVLPGSYDAILLGYGLCNQGLHGLQARGTTLVAPQAHDCLDLFLGSRARHRELCAQCPGRLFRTSGWMEHRSTAPELRAAAPLAQQGFGKSLEAWRQMYDEETARYLHETLSQLPDTYDTLTYIDLGVEPDGTLVQAARREADELGLRFTTTVGDLGWLRRLLQGAWSSSEFLEVPPGAKILSSRADDEVIRVCLGPIALAASETRQPE